MSERGGVPGAARHARASVASERRRDVLWVETASQEQERASSVRVLYVDAAGHTVMSELNAVTSSEAVAAAVLVAALAIVARP